MNDGRSLFGWPLELVSQNHSVSPTNLDRVSQCLRESKDTCYYGFEANPRFAKGLEAVRNDGIQRGMRVQTFSSTAFGLSNGVVPFVIDDGVAHDTGEVGLGSALAHTAEQAVQRRGGPRVINVSSVAGMDFLRHVMATTTELVALKLDVEGSEFDLMKKLLVEDAPMLCRLNVLAIEWHAHKAQHFERARQFRESFVNWLRKERPFRARWIMCGGIDD